MKKIMRTRRTPKVTRADSPTASKSRTVRTTQSARSKPKTAYDLLARVAEHIVEEPTRYDQDRWCRLGKRAIRKEFGFAPACVTMACRAGWIVGLHDGLRSKHLTSVDMWPNPVARRANDILDMGSWDTDELFAGGNIVGNPGTVKYAREGARGIRQFMKKHAEHLKSRLLADVPKA